MPNDPSHVRKFTGSGGRAAGREFWPAADFDIYIRGLGIAFFCLEFLTPGDSCRLRFARFGSQKGLLLSMPPGRIHAECRAACSTGRSRHDTKVGGYYRFAEE